MGDRGIADYRAAGEVLERISDGFVALDRDWRYLYVNARAAAMLGRERDSLIGKHIWTEFPEGVGQPFHLAYERAMREQVPLTLEAHYPPYDRWFENRIYPSPDGVAIFFTDITERKHAEEERTRLLARLEAQAADLERQIRERTAVIEVERQRAQALAELHIEAIEEIEMERALDLLVGATARLLPAERVFAVVWDDDDPAFAASATTLTSPSREELLAGARRPGSISVRVARSRAPLVIEDVARSPLADHPVMRERGIRALLGVPIVAEAGLSGALLVSETRPRDFGPDQVAFVSSIAGRAAAIVWRVRLITELRAAARAREEFLALMAHELRSPVAAIGLLADGLASIPTLGGRERAAAAGVRAQAEALTTLAEDILAVGSLEAGAMRLEMVPTDLRVLVGRAVTLASEPSRIQVRVPDGPVVAIVDPTQLGRALGNLLSNALKYSTENVEVELSRDARDAVVRIRDKGIGLSTDEIAQLFHKYARAGGRKEGVPPGIGLGLYLCRLIAEAHGGSISVESAGHGQGSAFTLRLPAAGSR